MRITVYIPSYELGDHFHRVANNFLNYEKYHVSLFVYTVQDFEKNKLNMNTETPILLKGFPPSIKQGLTFECYKTIPNDRSKYDLLIYCEDDILIKESVIDTFLEENKKLDDSEVIGVLRYEGFLGGRYLVEFDVTTAHNHSLEPIIQNINGRKYFSTENVHQGCWILEPRNLERLLINDQFIFTWGELSEDAASNIYRSNKWPGKPNGLNRLIPIDKVDDLMVHHLSDKYVHKFDIMWTPNKLKEKLNELVR